MSEQNSKH